MYLIFLKAEVSSVKQPVCGMSYYESSIPILNMCCWIRKKPVKKILFQASKGLFKQV